MSHPVSAADGEGTALRQLMNAQRQAFVAEGAPSLEVRRNRLDRLAASMLSSSHTLTEAVHADFGNRPLSVTLAADIATTIRDIGNNRAQLKRWMQPTRPQPLYWRLAGIKAWVEPQPLGVVGVISPWNLPVALALQPAAAAISAGNRVMIKTSELTPRTGEVLRDAIERWFSPHEVVVVTGDAATAAAFCRLPFDHMFFTGSMAIGKAVQLAAAEHLTPVTLELGGKNPAIVGADANLAVAARRIVGGRLANSGQTCHCPDYVFVPLAAERAFVDACIRQIRAILPSMTSNPQYCSIIDERHFDRILALVADARQKGAHVIEVIPPGETLPDRRCRIIPPTLVCGVDDAMNLMHEEIFGPVLAVLPYNSIDDVIRYLNARPAPLSMYWFGADGDEYRRLRRQTRSGGVTRNDFALHAAVDGLPFGGVGASGMGYYHGRFGFETFSHLRAVAEAPQRYTPTAIMAPPIPAKMAYYAEVFLRWQHRKFARRLRGHSLSSRGFPADVLPLLPAGHPIPVDVLHDRQHRAEDDA